MTVEYISTDSTLPTITVFDNQRLKFGSGLCVSLQSGTQLTVDFCNPRLRQSFTLTDQGQLVHHEKGQCVRIHSSETAALSLGTCSNSPVFSLQLTPDGYVISHTGGGSRACISPVRGSTHARGDRVGLGPCSPLNQTVPYLTLIPEAVFMKERRFTLLPRLPEDPGCDFPSCGINDRAFPARLIPDPNQPCAKLTECLTVVVTTAGRPLLVRRLLVSIRLFVGYDLPTVVVDDGPVNYTQTVWDELKRFPLLKYVVGQGEMGISAGRNVAISRVNTSYFFLVDDDAIFSEHTDVSRLVRVLEATDASVAGAVLSNSKTMSGGMLEFENLDGKPNLLFFDGACTGDHREPVVDFSDCFRCDLTVTMFAAKTKAAREVGLWNEHLKILEENEDFFLRLKGSRKKVVLCPEVKIVKAKAGIKKTAKKMQDGIMTKKLFLNYWNIDGVTYYPNGGRPWAGFRERGVPYHSSGPLAKTHIRPSLV